MKEIYRAANPIEAETILLLLANEGIEGQVNGINLAGATGEIPLGWMTIPRIAVDEEVAERARQIVLEWEQQRRAARNASEESEADESKSWTCPECGETVDFEFQTCWNCLYDRTAC